MISQGSNPAGSPFWAVLVVVLLKPTQEVIQPGIIPQTVHQINASNLRISQILIASINTI